MSEQQATTPEQLCASMTEAVVKALHARGREQVATWGEASEQIVCNNMPLAALFAAVAMAKQLDVDRDRFLKVAQEIISKELKSRGVKK